MKIKALFHFSPTVYFLLNAQHALKSKGVQGATTPSRGIGADPPPPSLTCYTLWMKETSSFKKH